MKGSAQSDSGDSLSTPSVLYDEDKKPFDLKDPNNIEYEVIYDPITNTYKLKEKVGDQEYRPGDEQNFDDFWKNRYKESERDYWKQKQQENTGTSSSSDVIGGIIPGGGAIRSIFGNDKIEIKPQGSAELIFGVTSTKTENPIIRVESQRVTSFDFDEKIQLNVSGKIGDKLELGTSYNTEASFDFENQMKLQYQGKEDEILKNIELGNVTMPLNSTLIQGSQSLFGVKTEMQFGKLNVQTVLSQQKSESKTIELSGGVQTKEVYIQADDYEDNRHFFLAQYFADNYNQSLSNPPILNSTVSIIKAEVWVTNVGISANPGARNVIGFMDLGENVPYDGTLTGTQIFPDNASNNLYNKINNDASVRLYNSASGELIGANYNYTAGIHFNKIENARKLTESEYFIHPQLGYISLNRKMEDDEVLAIAYQYTVIGSDQVYQVGEFSSEVTDVQSAIFLKMLKSTQVNNTNVPLWELMMKNVYSLGTYGVDASTLEIDIRYRDPSSNNDINFLNAVGANPNVSNKRWLEIMGMDRLDNLQNPRPDGKYDIIEGQTIRLQNGKIYFPVLEPFGNKLRVEINDNAIADTFAFDSLYHVSKFRAKNEFPTQNRFRIYARYSSKSNIINLNSFSIPRGAVTVTAGGRNLVEGVDFRVDYNMGQVTILNESILNSNTPIRVNVESNAMFSIMSKTLFGTNLQYEVNKDFHIGGTFINLTERPLTQKVNQGEEPIRNTMWGLNTDYRTESKYLTKVIDKLLYNTKAKSSIEIKGEFAQLVPGSPNAIENNGQAVSFIDDFEAGQTGIDIRNRITWTLASTPQGNPEWPEGDLINDLAYGFNRSKLAWYNIDPLFGSRDGVNTPDHIKGNKTIQENLYQRIILQSEIYPYKSLAVGEPPTLQTLDLAYFPEERGPYNYDTTGAPGISKGIDKTTGTLFEPETRWGGIMRKIDYVDFASQNIEFIEFWVMDPFPDDPSSMDDIDAFGGSMEGGDLYIHIGNISEDILRDGRKSFENGLPSVSDPNVDIDTTEWGFVSNKINLINAFDNDEQSREAQDVGFDGMQDRDEMSKYSKYLDYFGGTQNAPGNIGKDPGADNYQYFRGDNLDAVSANVIERYKDFNGTEANSPTQSQTGLDYVSTSTTLPDIEDLNRDNTLSEGESYYEYKISMRPDDLNEDDLGTNYLFQKIQAKVSGSGKSVNWYNFRIPVKSPDNIIGNIEGFQSIRFIRLALKGWKDPVVLRFGSLDLIRSDWRKYEEDLSAENSTPSTTPVFNVGAVNLEEDSKKTPIPYVLPPNTQRQFNLGSQNQENEQAMQIQVENLDVGDARAMYKPVNLDLLSYKRIQMDIHAEHPYDADIDLENPNMSVFLRMGSDYTENYYEYEIPLVFTDHNIPQGDDQKREAIWDARNRMDFDYEEVFANLKAKRNELNIPVTERYSTFDGKNIAIVKGSPSMANITSLMIGVRNNDTIGMETRDAEIWVNELRLSEFDQQGGWASTASVNMKLADFGNVSLSGGYSTPGWGAIDQKVSDRSRETVRNMNATSNFQLGKLLPEKIGLSLPVYMSYNQVRKDQKYNPLDTDIKINQLKNGSYKSYLLDVTPDQQTSRSINFSNVKKLKKAKKKKRLYDISNFDATFAYNENEKKDVNTKIDLVQNYKGGVNYNYNNRPKSIQPFKKTPIIKNIEKKHLAKLAKKEQSLEDSLKSLRNYSSTYADEIKKLQKEIKQVKKDKIDYRKNVAKLKRSKYLALYRDFNFQYMPQQIGVKTNMNRMFNEREIRNVSTANLLIEPTYNKNWYFNRDYTVKWDLTKTLKLNYNSSNNAIIDEPLGRIDSQEKKDSVWNNLRNFGRNTMFSQNVSANYRIPINKFPLTSWITANAKYTGKYDWQATNPAFVDSIGHNISNNNTRQINGQLNFVNLYNKSRYLKQINRGNKKRPSVKKNPKDTTQVKKPKVTLTPRDIMNHSVRAIMMLRNLSVNYSENNGTFLPGFMGESQALGMDVNKLFAPGYKFVLGSQEDILTHGIENKWFNESPNLITKVPQVSKTNRQNLNARATIEPWKRFKINLSGTRSLTTNDNYFYQIDSTLSSKYRKDTRVKTQEFSISTNTFKTSFSKTKTNQGSSAYKQMLNNRYIIANRLAQKNANWTGQTNPTTSFPEGYSAQHHEVLLYSFLSAYRGQRPEKIKINSSQTPGSTEGFFPSIPIPDWRFNYNGLKKLPIVRRYFRSISIAHAYKSTLSINGVQNNINFDGSGDTTEFGDFETNIDFYKVAVFIKESFNPLVKVDMKFHNSILAKMEVKKSRTVELEVSTPQVIESHTWDFIIGGGYTIKDLVIPNVEIKGRRLKSDLNLRLDVSVKSTRMIMLTIDGNPSPPNGGLITAIKISGDYKVSEKVTARAFYDQTINNPYISTSFPTSTSKGGVSIRFTL
tara:strand:- start:15131 stop:22354 length:7224 start_codon:yes stop_codon:yes gene_type:complete